MRQGEGSAQSLPDWECGRCDPEAAGGRAGAAGSAAVIGILSVCDLAGFRHARRGGQCLAPRATATGSLTRCGPDLESLGAPQAPGRTGGRHERAGWRWVRAIPPWPRRRLARQAVRAGWPGSRPVGPRL